MKNKTYENCKNVRRFIVNRAAEVMNYGWTDDFCAKQIREIKDKVLKEVGEIDIAELTGKQMDDLGFGRWEKSNPMRLIPLWLFQFLPPKIECESISGIKMVLEKSKMDNDNRGGYLAYGIWPKKK